VIPDPWSVVSGGAGAVAAWSWDQVAAGIARWVLEALAAPIDGVLNFLKTSARPNMTAPWFAGADSPFAAVRNLGAVLLVGFLLAGIVQGVVAGDVAGMLRRIALDAPMAVLGMIGITVVVDLLLDLTDAMSTAVLGGSDGDALQFLTTVGVQAQTATGGFSTVVLGIVALVAAFMIWIELMIRASLLYLLVALSPLVFAASVWPSAKGALRRLVEVMLAVILSKLVISIALAVGVAALGGMTEIDQQGEGVGEFAAQGLGKLVVGTAILAMAAFSPFIVLRLIPVAEAAVVANGISRAPLNTARSAMNTAYYGRSIGRLGGGGGSGGGEGPAAPPDAQAPPFGPSGGHAAAGSAAPAGDAGTSAGATATSPSASSAGTAASGAAAGPAVAATAAVAAAKTAKDTATSTAASTADQASERGTGTSAPTTASRSTGVGGTHTASSSDREPVEPPERPSGPSAADRVAGGEQ
jgi:hypothetical protein